MLVCYLFTSLGQFRQLRLVFFLLTIIFSLNEAKDPISELFIIDQHLVLYRCKPVDDGVKVLVCQMILEIQLENIVKFLPGNIAVVLFVNLVDSYHDLFQLVRFLVQEQFNEVLFTNLGQALLVSEPLAQTVVP